MGHLLRCKIREKCQRLSKESLVSLKEKPQQIHHQGKIYLPQVIYSPPIYFGNEMIWARLKMDIQFQNNFKRRQGSMLVQQACSTGHPRFQISLKKYEQSELNKDGERVKFLAKERQIRLQVQS